MQFHQPTSSTSTTSKVNLTDAQAELNPVPFQKSEIAVVQRAVGDAGKLCSAVAKVLGDYMAGSSGGSKQQVGKLLQSAFGIGHGFAGDSPRVNRLRKVVSGIPKRLDGATYYRVVSPPESLHVATTEPGSRINVKTPFFTLNFQNSQRAIILVHEAIHMLQNAIAFEGQRDKKFQKISPKQKVEFEQLIYYPYHYQWFFCELFKVPNPSDITFSAGSTITPSKKKP